jgi:predicted nucleic acid-binding protein
MASTKNSCFYWDSNVFLAYLNAEPGRVNIVTSLWRDVSNGNRGKVFASVESIVEVATVAEERNIGIHSGTLAKIDAIWSDPNLQMVEAPELVMRRARKLIRDAFSQSWTLTPKDAIHIATAMWIDQHTAFSIVEFHTYDKKLMRFAPMAGLTICEPHAAQPSFAI